jgi:hypothetical protein
VVERAVAATAAKTTAEATEGARARARAQSTAAPRSPSVRKSGDAPRAGVRAVASALKLEHGRARAVGGRASVCSIRGARDGRAGAEALGASRARSTKFTTPRVLNYRKNRRE